MDWFDTVSIVLKRKTSSQLSFLHLYHHATIGAVWGYLLYCGHGNGTAAYGAWINSLTHVLMYTHYLVTSFKINNPLKGLLTSWQIGQFYSCFAHACTMLFVFPEWETNVPIKFAWIQFC